MVRCLRVPHSGLEEPEPMAARQVASQTEKEPARSSWLIRPTPMTHSCFTRWPPQLPTPGYKYTHILSDIQSLNEAALTKLTTSPPSASPRIFPARQIHPARLRRKFRRRLRPSLFPQIMRSELKGKRVGVQPEDLRLSSLRLYHRISKPW